MTYTTTGSPFSSSFGTAPRALVLLIMTTCGISLTAGLLDRFITGYLGIMSPHLIFGLSWGGLYDAFFWQPLSYLFFHHGMGGLSLGFLIELGFSMYLLYFMGNAVAQHFGVRPFLISYFAAGLAASGAALLTSSLFGLSFLLLGSGPAVYGIMTLWAMLHPQVEIMLFLAFRLSGRAVWLGLLLISVLIDLSQGNLIGVTTYLAGSLTGYLIGVIGYDLRGPFPHTHKIDAAIASLGSGIRERQRRTQEMMNTVYHKAKVFDFETGEAILDDEEFTDAMLTKISKYGEKSLSRQERKRLKQISDSKKQ